MKLNLLILIILLISCTKLKEIPQTKLEIKGVPSDIINCPINGITASRPGWADIHYNKHYQNYGTDLIDSLIAYFEDKNPNVNENINENVNVNLLLLVAQLSSDLNYKKSIPFLIKRLELITPNEDTTLGNCLISKLAELTKIKNGYRYYRRWFDPEVQKLAISKLKEWLQNNPT